MTNQPGPTDPITAVSPTAAQKIAIAHRCGEMVVLAGAGSGKTATLANRCAELVTNTSDPCDVRELLVLTFTREAADEMRSRIARAIRRAATDQTDNLRAQRLHQQAALADTAQISTFHAFCNWAAKTWFMFCRVDPGFSLLNEHEAAMLQSDALRETAREFMADHHPHHDDFMEIFDLYSGASPAKLETLIGPILRTVETVVDPGAWCQVVAETGDTETGKVIATFIHQKCRRLHELAVILSANADEARLFDADKNKAMYTGLTQAAQAALTAESLLRQDGPAGWKPAAEHLKTVKFADRISLQKIEDNAEASHFREGTYKPLKDSFTKLRDELAGCDIAHLVALETTSRRRIATILAFAAAVQSQYLKAKQSRRQLDYSDLERTILAALSTPDNPLQTMLHQRFRHILVDEYQDINPVQQRLIELLYRGDKPADGLKPGSLFAVGDVLQSIYGFRGSEPRILHDKVTALQNAGLTEKVITMRENFRTLPPLIDALNAIMDPMLRMADSHSPPQAIPMAEFAILRHGRKEAGTDAYPGAPVQLHVITKPPRESAAGHDSDDPDADAESAAVNEDDPIAEMHADEMEATRIGQLILDMQRRGCGMGPEARPIELKDIAILLRAPGRRAPHYVRALIAMGINANAALTTGFFESGEVLEVLDILRVLDNPEQDIALAGVLLGPIGDCTTADLAMIRKTTEKHIPFHQAVRKLADHGPSDAATGELVKKIARANNTMERWRAMLRTETLVHGLSRILREAGLLNRAAAMTGGRQRLANLRLLQQRAMEFSGFDLQSISRFLTFFDRLREERDLGEATPPAGNSVRVMSIHGSKGLEFPVVFVAALGAGFNKRDSRQRLLVDRDKGIGITVLDDNGVLTRDSPGRMVISDAKEVQLLQEEARLLYVAMTRARDQLVLVGRMAESAVDKWSNVRISGDLSRGNCPSSLKPANCPLSWLGPIFSQYTSTTDTVVPLLTLRITPQEEIRSAIATSHDMPPTDMTADGAEAIAPGSSISPVISPVGELNAVFDRITHCYPYAEFTRLPAVSSVSRLKTLSNNDPESPSFIMDLPAPAVRLDISKTSSGVQTGLIMHRVLQRLDLTQQVTADSLNGALTDLVNGGFLTDAESKLVDHDALLWFFAAPLGQRLQTAAKKADREHQLLRELSFIWSVPAVEISREFLPVKPGGTVSGTLDEVAHQTHAPTTDQTLIRGTIDALLIEQDRVEIIDYKTDAAAFIESRLPAYQRQVAYYARAAGAILNRPIEQTSLIFFSARRIEHVAR